VIKGWKKLTKAEKKHVTFDAGCRNTESWLRNIKYQYEHYKSGEGYCQECIFIARKLDDWPEDKKENKESK